MFFNLGARQLHFIKTPINSQQSIVDNIFASQGYSSNGQNGPLACHVQRLRIITVKTAAYSNFWPVLIPIRAAKGTI